MPHGAPDHVRMGDVNLLDYIDHYTRVVAEIIIPGGAYSPINVTGVGCFGSFYFEVDDRFTGVDIYVDGVRWVRYHLLTMWERNALGGIGCYPNCGIVRYDLVNDKYAFWIDFNWHLSYKTALELRIISNAAGNITCNYINAFWKERV